MAVKDFEIKNDIISFLRQNEGGSSASDIAKNIGFNRVTVGKYLQVLQAEKLVTSRRVASAIFWQLSNYSEKPRVLVVDDEKNIVDLIRLSLANGRYDVYEAYDGEEALEMVNKIVPNLIILDLMMPKVSGDEVCRQLKSNVLTQNIPVIIVSAKGEVTDKVELMSIGADDYITKPFDPMELEARVANKLKRSDLVYSKNPVTNLPTEIITKETSVVWAQKKKYFQHKLVISNFDDYVALFGHKKGFEVLQLFSRMLVDTFSKDVFVGHISDKEFLILSETSVKPLIDELKKRFTQTVPFFYPEIIDSFSNHTTTIKVNKTGSEVNHEVISLEVFFE